MRPDPKTSLPRNALLTFGRQFLAGGLRVGVLLVIARMVGPAGAGTYAVALIVPTVLSQMLNFGLPTANIYYLASGRLSRGQLWSASLITWAAATVVGLSVGGWVVVARGAEWLPGAPQPVLLLLLAVFPFLLLFGLTTSLLQAVEDFTAFNALVLIEPLLTLVLLLGLWAAGRATLEGAAAATLAAHVIACLASVAAVGWIRTRTRPARVSAGEIRALAGYSLKSHLSNVVALLNYRVDLFIVNLLAGAYAAGLYSTAVRLAEQVWIISQAVSTVLFPRLSAMANDEAARRALTATVARATLWATVAAAGAVAALSSVIVPLLFGAEFAPAVLPLLCLLPGVALFACSRVLANGLAARGLTSINLAFALAALMLNALGAIIFVPRYGAAGAAAVTSSVYVFDLTIRLALSKPLVGVAWWRVLTPARSDFAVASHLVRNLRKSA